jgi:hypothetical protein
VPPRTTAAKQRGKKAYAMARSAESYKQLSIREFTKAAKNYESGKAGKKLMKRGASGPARNEIPGKKLFFLKKTIDFARQRLYNTFLHEVTTVTVVSSKEV